MLLILNLADSRKLNIVVGHLNLGYSALFENIRKLPSVMYIATGLKVFVLTYRLL